MNTLQEMHVPLHGSLWQVVARDGAEESAQGLQDKLNLSIEHAVQLGLASREMHL